MRIIKPSQIDREDVKAPLFTGVVSRQTLIPKGASETFNMSIVNFPRGVRNKFHAHTSDQILIVTAGHGIVATEEKEFTVTEGDIIHIPAGEKHWHGAGEDSDFSHITILAVGGKLTQLEG